MRKIFLVLYILSGLLVCSSCEDDAPTAIIKSDVTPNTLDVPSSSSFILVKENAANDIDVFNWTAPDYGLKITATYSVELDLASNDFKKAITLFTTNALSGSITIGDINKKLLDFGLAPEESSSVEIRVKSTVNSNIDPVYSNSRQFSITPYATSFPPIYIVGDAQNWEFAKAVKVKKIAPGTYVTTANFVEGGTFRFFDTLTWDAKVWNTSFFEGGSIDKALGVAGDKDQNFKFIGATGTYKITVSTIAKTITLEAADTPTLFLLGDGQGWSFENAVVMNWLGGGHFQATSTFTPGKFRFFGKKDDWNSGYKYSYFSSFVDSKFKDAGDNDGNFISPDGSYTVDVDLEFLTINVK